MKIAILLTGLDDEFHKIKHRIYSQFDKMDADIDFFAHTWEEIIEPFERLDYTVNPVIEILNHTKPKLLDNRNDDKIKYVATSSYQEILKYIDTTKCNNHDVIVFSFIAQNLSVYHAFAGLQSYIEETNTSYDLIVKWRYDLILEDDATETWNEYLPKIVNDSNVLHVHDIFNFKKTDIPMMIDYFYMASYDVFKEVMQQIIPKIVNRLNIELKKEDRDKINSYVLYHEAVLMLTMQEILHNRISCEHGSKIRSGVIFRPTLDPNASANEIDEYNRNGAKTKGKKGWIHKGWDERIINQ